LSPYEYLQETDTSSSFCVQKSHWSSFYLVFHLHLYMRLFSPPPPSIIVDIVIFVQLHKPPSINVSFCILLSAILFQRGFIILCWCVLSIQSIFCCWAHISYIHLLFDTPTQQTSLNPDLCILQTISLLTKLCSQGCFNFFTTVMS
jgi:hypothetical protein